MNTLEKYKELCENVTKTYDEQVIFVNAYMNAIDTLLKGKVDEVVLQNIVETIKGIKEKCTDIDDINERVKIVFKNNNRALPSGLD